MSIATLPNRNLTSQPGDTAAVRRLHRVLTVARAVLVRTSGRVVGGIARLVAWFAAEPRRVRVTLIGFAACSVLGALVGLGAGYALSRLTTAALGLIETSQAQG